jgi:hypothetical protein
VAYARTEISPLCRMPDRPSKLARVKLCASLYASSAASGLMTVSVEIRQYTATKGAVHGERERFVYVSASGYSLAQRQRRP